MFSFLLLPPLTPLFPLHSRPQQRASGEDDREDEGDEEGPRLSRNSNKGRDGETWLSCSRV